MKLLPIIILLTFVAQIEFLQALKLKKTKSALLNGNMHVSLNKN